MKRFLLSLSLCALMAACTTGEDTPSSQPNPYDASGDNSDSKGNSHDPNSGGNNNDRNLANNNDRSSRGNSQNVRVLCRCGDGYVSWSGVNEASAKAGVKRNCESLGSSVSHCKVVN